MAVKRIVANVAAKQIDAAKAFYGDALGMAGLAGRRRDDLACLHDPHPASME